MKPIAWQVSIGNNGQTQYADWIHYYTLGRGGCPLNEDGTWIEGHPYHWKANDSPSKRLQLISVKKLYTADQLRAAKVEVLREAALRWSFTGKTNSGYEQVVREEELRRMADEIEKGE